MTLQMAVGSIPRVVGGDIVDFDKENLNDFYNTRGIAIS